MKGRPPGPDMQRVRGASQCTRVAIVLATAMACVKKKPHIDTMTLLFAPFALFLVYVGVLWIVVELEYRDFRKAMLYVYMTGTPRIRMTKYKKLIEASRNTVRLPWKHKRVDSGEKDTLKMRMPWER
jgi:hypothetical protein